MQQQVRAQTIPGAGAAAISASNAQRIARRRAIAGFAQDISRTGQGDLSRGPRRQVGGRFRTIQDIPEPQQLSQQAFSQQDLERFLSAFRFEPSQQVLSERTQGQTIPRALLAPGTERRIRARAARGSGRRIDPFARRGRSFNVTSGFLLSPF